MWNMSSWKCTKEQEWCILHVGQCLIICAMVWNLYKKCFEPSTWSQHDCERKLLTGWKTKTLASIFTSCKYTRKKLENKIFKFSCSVTDAHFSFGWLAEMMRSSHFGGWASNTKVYSSASVRPGQSEGRGFEGKGCFFAVIHVHVKLGLTLCKTFHFSYFF